MRQLLLSSVLTVTNMFAQAYDVIAHRGIHQTYNRVGLGNDTCTADRIFTPTHSHLENTISSIKRAFELGATIVELDIHPTTEINPEQNQIIVFHDWTLNCRTEASCATGCKCNSKNECVTHDQTLDYLKTLDIGYGYTSDGKTYPFRGQFQGQIPTFREVLSLLLENQSWKILVNVKDNFPKTQELLARELSEFPHNVRSRVLVESSKEYVDSFREIGVQDPIWQGGGPAKKCFGEYIAFGAFGYFPKSCRNIRLFVPLHETMERASFLLKNVKLVSLLWGWPEKFIQRAQSHGTGIYISQVDTPADWEFVRRLDTDGIMTNKIEVIGSLVQKKD